MAPIDDRDDPKVGKRAEENGLDIDMYFSYLLTIEQLMSQPWPNFNI
jgi:hypothetical protein